MFLLKNRMIMKVFFKYFHHISGNIKYYFYNLEIILFNKNFFKKYQKNLPLHFLHKVSKSLFININNNLKLILIIIKLKKFILFYFI